MVSFIHHDQHRGQNHHFFLLEFVSKINRRPCFSIILKFLSSSCKQHYSSYDHKGGVSEVAPPPSFSHHVQALDCCRWMRSLCDKESLHSRTCVVLAVPMRCQFGPARFFHVCVAPRVASDADFLGAFKR